MKKEMDGSKYRSKGYAMASAGKKLPYVLLLLLAFAAAALSVVVLHKVRDRRAFAGLLQERDRQLVSLRIELHKEKAFNKEMKRKVEEMKATTSSLRTQKTDQKTKLRDLETTLTNLKRSQKEVEAALMEKDSRINLMEETAKNLENDKNKLEAALTEKERRIKQMEEKSTNTQKELEAALKDKDSRIKQLEEKATNVNNTRTELEAVLREKESRIIQMEAKAKGSNPDQMAALMEILQRKEAELEEIKTRFQGNMMTNQAGMNGKSGTHGQMRNTTATPDIRVTKRSTNSSSAIPVKSVENRSSNTSVVQSSHPKDRTLEEKRSANTTILGSSLPKDKSLEEKKLANTTVLGSTHQNHKSLEEKRPVNTTVLVRSVPKDRSLEEKKPANTTVVNNTHSSDKSIEAKKLANTTVVESTHLKEKTMEEKKSSSAVENSPPKDRSLQEKQMKFTSNKEDDGIQGNNIDDFDEYLDDIYGESRSKKSRSSQKNKKFVSNNQANSQEDEFAELWNSLDQDSDRVRYNRLLEKANANPTTQIKKNGIDEKKAVERMVGSADVKPNISTPVKSDETKQQNKKQKKRSKSKKKKLADTLGTTVVGGEAAKQKAPDATSISI